MANLDFTLDLDEKITKQFNECIQEEEIEWPIWVGPEGATDEELYGEDND